MRRLTCVRRDDQGAIAVIVALFMFFVAFGSAAMTIDVGNTNTDRRQRQNGVDAVALAVTKQCAEHAPIGNRGSGDCGVKIAKLVG